METEKRSFFSKCCYQNNIAYVIGVIGVIILIIIGFNMTRRITHLSSELASCRSSSNCYV